MKEDTVLDEEYLRQHPDLQEKIRAAGRENVRKIYARIAAERQGSAQAKKGSVTKKEGISSKSTPIEHAKKR